MPFASSWLVHDGYCLPSAYVALELNATLVVPGPDEQSYWVTVIAESTSELWWKEPPGGWSTRVTHENVADWLDAPDLTSFDRWTCVSSSRMYAAAVYWSSMSITSIGYGDISATPRNHYEMYWAAGLMLLCGVCWSQVLATMTQVLATMRPADTSFKVAMDDLNRFMKSYELPVDNQLRLREYFQRTKHLQISGANNSLLCKMSPKLQGEVLLHCNQSWIKRVDFLQGVDDEFVAALVLNLVPIVFAPSETVFGTSLYVVHRGLALFGGKLLKSGMVWGEDMLLEAAHLRSPFCARALNYLEVYMISRAEVFAIADHYPESKHKLRMYVCRVAFRRFFILMTREKKQLAELRLRFPDTLGALLDQLDAGAERLRDLKNAGVYGGWAGDDPDAEQALENHASFKVTGSSRNSSTKSQRPMGDSMLMAFSNTSQRPEVTTVCSTASAQHHTALGDAQMAAEHPSLIQTGKAGGALAPLRLQDALKEGTAWHADQAHSMAVPHPDVRVEAWHTATAGAAAAADPMASSRARRAAAMRADATSSKSHPGREVFRASAAGTATDSPSAPTTSVPTPRDSASFTAARASGSAAAPPHRGGRPKKNNFAAAAAAAAAESRVQATVEAALAPLRTQLEARISALQERMDAQHAETLKAIAPYSAPPTPDGLRVNVQEALPNLSC